MCKVSRVGTSAVNKIQGKNDIQVYTTTRLGLCFAIVLTLQPSYQTGEITRSHNELQGRVLLRCEQHDLGVKPYAP